MTYGPPNSQGQFLNYTITLPLEGEDLRDKLTDSYQQIASAVNNREFSVYTPQELPNGQQYYNNANPQKFFNVYRKLIDFGELPDSSTQTVAHGLTFNASSIMTHVYGAASDPVNFDYLPIPFSSPTLNENILLQVDGTNVTITTGIDRTAFTVCYVVLEYIKG